MPRRKIPCSKCGGPTGYTSAPSRTPPAEPICQPCRNANAYRTKGRDAKCPVCHQPFVTYMRSDHQWQKCCSRSCAAKLQQAQAFPNGRDPEKLRIKIYKRRAAIAGVDRDPYTLAEIAERDHYVCHLCGDLVDMTLKSPHPMSASIDHVVPISKGGDDTRENIKLAHRIENCQRQDRSISEWIASRAPGLPVT